MGNRFLIRSVQHSHAAEQTVEWLYAFDVHCNAFFPLFLVLYVLQASRGAAWLAIRVCCPMTPAPTLQFILSPLLLQHSVVTNLLSIALYVVAFTYYHYLTFLGFAALPFLENTQVRSLAFAGRGGPFPIRLFSPRLQVYLWPMAAVLLLVPFSVLGGFNPTRFTLAIYFGQ